MFFFILYLYIIFIFSKENFWCLENILIYDGIVEKLNKKNDKNYAKTKFT